MLARPDDTTVYLDFIQSANLDFPHLFVSYLCIFSVFVHIRAYVYLVAFP